MVNTITTPSIISFVDLEEKCIEVEGLVFIDASSRDKPWEKALTIIEEQGVAKASDFQEPFFVQTTGGRKDLIVFYNNENTIDFEKFSALRIDLCRRKHKEIGRICWTEDFLMNYQKQFQPMLEIFAGPGMDRINPTKGYVDENIQLVQLINDNDPYRARRAWE